MTARHDPIDAIYEKRCHRFAAERDRVAERDRWLGRARFMAFLAIVAALALPLPPSLDRLGARAATALFFFVVFLALILVQSRVQAESRRYRELYAINEQARHRRVRDWDALPAPTPLEHDDPIAEDLDLFGHASLMQLLGPAGSALGARTLAMWLLRPAETEVVAARQAAVDELAPELDFRDELAVRGRLMNRPRAAAVDAFFDWAEGPRWLSQRRWLTWLSWLLPAATLAGVVADVAGLLGYYAWLLPVTAALFVTYGPGRDVHRIFDRVALGEDAFHHYAAALQLISEAPFDAAPLRRLQARFTSADRTAHAELARLHRLTQHSELRLSMFYLPVQLLTLWDLHVLRALERWQRRCGDQVRGWLVALAELQALSALAALRHDHPNWVFPELTREEPPRLEARDLGHPLLSDDERVCNDVELGPPGTFLLVTGSNMSGKSTLLRAIGTNAVLAGAGAPVCASRMRLAPVVLRTSMRVHDSLEAGLSHFMAELERLREIVTAARTLKDDAPDRALLYLLDDVLQGTNSAERRIAARRVIEQLLRAGAIGAITTHDLELAETEELRAARRPVHFEETIEDTPEGPIVSFDYKLRSGLATSRNALQLLRLVGLDAPQTPDQS